MPTRHPAELTLRDIMLMDRLSLIEELRLFERHCFCSLATDLGALPSDTLRKLLYAARCHYHSKGY
jgi:hypothetical protein